MEGLRRLTGGPGTADRRAWRECRLALEASGLRHTVLGPRRSGGLLYRSAPAMARALRLVGLHGLGERNARTPVLERRELALQALPAAFEGYRILHLSDPHFENLPGLAESAARQLRDAAVDLVAITGDFQHHWWVEPQAAVEALALLLDGLRAADGCLAVLGNHDGAGLVEPLEAAGVLVLVNEHAAVTRGGERLIFTGTDDPACFFTAGALSALEAAPEGLRIALVHSPELAQPAAAAGHSLYLCGHTHGGQICLPGGRPLVTQLTVNRHLARGWWRQGAMVGHTSRGLGSANLSVRFNCPPAMTLITCRRPA
ncbi:hypothetical protein SAMN06265365_102229 [Tistlia consotensis]|uniref:Calcineurin-like phosphoesterase domain-containing protein n=2 Tax=Tistlia TaxID=1321364 RepID=A0A1Y6BK13_9PROT|nr:hypothetical protein SAMN05428998_10487 [Tistlia consotensis USBA 355]SNR35728.1 hypothetical protein SAMN06265365_102229 [Tistlia consotensis]